MYTYEEIEKDMFNLRNNIQSLVEEFEKKHSGKIQLDIEHLEITTVSDEYKKFEHIVTLDWQRKKIDDKTGIIIKSK